MHYEQIRWRAVPHAVRQSTLESTTWYPRALEVMRLFSRDLEITRDLCIARLGGVVLAWYSYYYSRIVLLRTFRYPQ